MNSISTLKEHDKDFTEDSYLGISLEDYGKWIDLFTKRASTRTSKELMEKDLERADNYYELMGKKLEFHKEAIRNVRRTLEEHGLINFNDVPEFPDSILI